MQRILPAPTLLALAPYASAGKFHISPTGGDTGGGPAQKPFATLERARDAARAGKGSKGVLARRPDPGLDGKPVGKP